jgi:hypothetical protein
LSNVVDQNAFSNPKPVLNERETSPLESAADAQPQNPKQIACFFVCTLKNEGIVVLLVSENEDGFGLEKAFWSTTLLNPSAH